MKQYDLHLPNWGPYNKEYLGISNIADKKRGVRFEFDLFPGFFRRSVMLTKSVYDSGVKIMKSSTDVSHYLYRYELMWKDQIFVDADFQTDACGDVRIACRLVNNTDEAQSLTLNGCASVKFPTFMRQNIACCEFCGNALWIDAADYTDIESDEKIAQDGLKRSERRASGFVGGSCIDGTTFSDGFIAYNISTVSAKELHIRYQAENAFAVKVLVQNRMYHAVLPASHEVTTFPIQIEETEVSSVKLYLPYGEYRLDGLIIGENDLRFACYTDDFVPEVVQKNKRVILKYAFATYEISWDYDDYVVRELLGEGAGEIIADKVHNHTSNRLTGNGKGHYLDVFIRPVFLAAKSEKTVTFCLKRLDKAQMMEVNHAFASPVCNSDGEKYRLSQEIMQATTLTNVVFPVFLRGEYIRHNTPGRFWDCLYTWDSGFIGMGLNTMDKSRAFDCLNTYLTEQGDQHAPLIFHGSVVPTQVFLYQELWNKNLDRVCLEKLYASMEQYYNFYSSINDPQTGLSKTWDLFYNSGGWDDYPPQSYVHANDLTKQVYPVITTAITVLCAKIMRNFANKLGRDCARYDADIEKMTRAIQTYCWDEETGYFGYTKHEDGKVSLMLYKDRINYNMGFDGIYPLIADTCTEAQKKRILANIADGLMTEFGVSVVDTRAPYFSKSGYWNGSVWMPHQWILWKALLDQGEEALSTKIAKTALEVFHKEVSLTYNCYEHFMLQNGRGAGFHQFSGLTTPVLMWFRAYYSPGTVSTGFQTLIDEMQWDDGYTSLSLQISATAENSVAVIVLNEKWNYQFSIDGKKVDSKKVTNGAYVVKLQKGRLSTEIL